MCDALRRQLMAEPGTLALRVLTSLDNDAREHCLARECPADPLSHGVIASRVPRRRIVGDGLHELAYLVLPPGPYHRFGPLLDPVGQRRRGPRTHDQPARSDRRGSRPLAMPGTDGAAGEHRNLDRAQQLGPPEM